ncbi:putative cyclic nucleotide-gated ion channel 8 [Platanthera guangdongensis]|uniref:Cyclic nucleotide-gated ion channel 8 n=1 Tax=Platanthera guangdongensis TaxID=2320717 RepID=A0ABR2MXQ1_9ASPA
MLDCSRKAQYMEGQKEKFVRLEQSNRTSFPSNSGNMKRCSFYMEGFGGGPKNPKKSFKVGMKRGSQGLKSLGKSLKFKTTKGIFQEDLKVSEKKIFDPQDKFILTMTKFFLISCIFAISIDPLFFYLPVYDGDSNCLAIDRKLAYTATTLRSIIDSFYLFRMALQFRTAYIAPSSRVFGRGELVIDPAQIANQYLRRFFIVDFLAVLPLPQYIPRFIRILPLTSELKRTAGVFAETAWAASCTVPRESLPLAKETTPPTSSVEFQPSDVRTSSNLLAGMASIPEDPMDEEPAV